MSRYRASPSRSPFRSPARLYETERDAIIEDQIKLKSALKAESDIRRMSDDLALLQIKVRQTNDLEDKVESLLRQNSQLARDNDELARQLNEKRYELERLRATAAEHHDRESIRSGQLYEANKSLELQIELLKKQRIEGNRLFEAHIQKLERMLDQKVIELDATSLKCSELSKELELATIRFEEERNRLKNLMTRTQHELERELQYTKQKQTSEKFSQIDGLKRNHAAQLALLEDEIAKLKGLNALKTEEFESQLHENKNLRKRHDEQVRLLGAENDDLRARMLKLEELNRSQVENIQVKYNDYHTQGTSSLKEQHGREMMILLEEIDKQKWLINQKNAEIQNLVQQKRDLRRLLDQTQLELGSEIDSLKNKLYSQQERHGEDSHNLMARINEITNKALSDSEGYHERVKEFINKISKLESEINDKQNQGQKYKKLSEQREKELKTQINNLVFSLQKTKRELQDNDYERRALQKEFDEYRAKTQAELKDIHAQLNQTQVKLQNAEQKILRQGDDHSDAQDILKIEIESLKKTITVLEEKLSQEQRRHAKQMQQFSANLNQKLKKLQETQRKALDQLDESRKQEIAALTARIQKLTRDKEYAENELKRYIEMYVDLQKYFKEPHEGALFEEKSKNSIYQVLQKVSKSSIHIF